MAAGKTERDATDAAAAMSDREIIMSRIIDAPREFVFKALATKS
jgi:uncharacterized protein YndB with AHSA1/START domain